MSCRTEISLRRGFTLIELLVVIAIIATLASVVGPAVFGNVAGAKASAVKSQLQVFSLALDAYRIDNDHYPTTSEGLRALREPPSEIANRGSWRGPYLRQVVPTDPWGRPYVYAAPGVANPDSYDLFSLGRDGRVGGSGEDSDITSWNGAVAR